MKYICAYSGQRIQIQEYWKHTVVDISCVRRPCICNMWSCAFPFYNVKNYHGNLGFLSWNIIERSLNFFRLVCPNPVIRSICVPIVSKEYKYKKTEKCLGFLLPFLANFSCVLWNTWRLFKNSSHESIKIFYYDIVDKIVLNSMYILWVILWFCLGFTPKWSSVYSIVAMCTTRPAELLSVYQAIIDTHNRQAGYSVT